MESDLSKFMLSFARNDGLKKMDFSGFGVKFKVNFENLDFIFFLAYI